MELLVVRDLAVIAFVASLLMLSFLALRLTRR